MQTLTPQTITQEKQNKIKYVVQDLEELWGVPEEITRYVLLRRGFNKWINNRKKFIQLKEKYRKLIREKLQELAIAKKEKRYYHIAKLKGELKILVKTRQEIRKICHSPRWVFPK